MIARRRPALNLKTQLLHRGSTGITGAWSRKAFLNITGGTWQPRGAIWPGPRRIGFGLRPEIMEPACRELHVAPGSPPCERRDLPTRKSDCIPALTRTGTSFQYCRRVRIYGGWFVA